MIEKKSLYEWCRIAAEDLPSHPDLKIPFRIVNSSSKMGELMAREFADEIKHADTVHRPFRAIVPCGPKSWYEPFARIVNSERISLKDLVVFHMDECLNWECGELAEDDPYNFRAFMERYFYGAIDAVLNVPAANRNYLSPRTMEAVREKIAQTPVDYTLGVGAGRARRVQPVAQDFVFARHRRRAV